MYRPLQFLARQIVFPSIVATGLQKILWPDGNKIQILMYHGVNSTGDTSINGRHISSDRFEKHLQYLKKNFEVLTLTDAYSRVGTKKSGKPRVAITFDDGFENNLTYAAPLLRKYDLPATFFISTVCVTEESDILWPDVVDLILACTDSVTVKELEFIRSNGRMMNISLGKTLQQFIKDQDCTERDAIISELSERYDIESKKKATSTEKWKLMSAKQLQELSAFPLVDIGSHCHNHYNLASLSLKNAERELRTSKELLETCIGKNVRSVAFPDGSYTSDTKQLAYDCGYDQLCAVMFKLPDDAQDPKILKRSSVSATTNNYSNIIHFHKLFKADGN